jgi:hypothetical protein
MNITGYTTHATERMIERKITKAQVEQTVRLGKITQRRTNPGHKGLVFTYEMTFESVRLTANIRTPASHVRVAITANGLVVTVTH